MTITLYKQSKDKKCIDKLTGATTIKPLNIKIKPTEKINILYPVFEIEYGVAAFGANYLKCDYGNGVIKYYYIDNISINIAQRMELHCTIDVRQTFGAAFIQCDATITRAEKIGQPTQYNDTKLPVYPNHNNITSIVMPETGNNFSGDGNYCSLLTVIGGEPTA